MVEPFENEIFITMRNHITKMFAEPVEEELARLADSPSVTERPSVDWSVLKDDLEGLSAGQLTLVLNLIEEMKKVNT